MDEKKTKGRMDVNKDCSIQVIEEELNWLTHYIEFRFKKYFKQDGGVEEPEVPSLQGKECYYTSKMKELNDNLSRMIILIALAPHIKPALLDVFFTKNESLDRVFTEFGGVKGDKFSGFIPTAETAAFIIAGSDLGIRMELQKRLDDHHALYRKNILFLGQTNYNESLWAGELIISEEFLT